MSDILHTKHMTARNVGKTEASSFEEISALFENREAADRLKEALVLKPIRHEPVKQVTHAPRVKRIVLLINHAYPVNRSYI